MPEGQGRLSPSDPGRRRTGKDGLVEASIGWTSGWRQAARTAKLAEISRFGRHRTINFERASGPDKSVLTRILLAFQFAVTKGWNWCGSSTSTALHNYHAPTGRGRQSANPREFEEKLDKLASSLEAYVAKPTTEDAQSSASRSVGLRTPCRRRAGRSDPTSFRATQPVRRDFGRRDRGRHRGVGRRRHADQRLHPGNRCPRHGPHRGQITTELSPDADAACSTRSSSARPRARTSATTAR